MRITVAILALVCLSAGTPAQEPQDATTTLKTLEAAWADALTAHRKQQQEEAAAARAALEKAKKEGTKSVRAMRAYSPFPSQEITNKHIAAFGAAANRFAGTPDAVPFHLWIVEQGRFGNNQDATKESIETLFKNHSKSQKLERLARSLKELRRLLGTSYCDRRLITLARTNKEPNTRAFALFAITEEPFAKAASGTPAYKLARARMVLAHKTATKAGLQAVIQGKIDLREKLGEGSVAPDITGIDMDGTPFKLSDYKGKVIMLDFWGDW